MEITPRQQGHEAARFNEENEPYFGPQDDGCYGTVPTDRPARRPRVAKRPQTFVEDTTHPRGTKAWYLLNKGWHAAQHRPYWD
jgi:hypothetical protein